MSKRTLALALLLSAFVTHSVVRAEDNRMVVLENQDIGGHVFKRLGLPNRNYCWEQCLQDARCTGTRWAVIAGATAGQCQLFSGELAYGEPREIKTGDGQQIQVTASRKEVSPSKDGTDKSGT